MDSEYQPGQAKFNAAMASAMRLNELLIDANTFSRTITSNYDLNTRVSSLNVYFATVECFFREISNKMLDQDIEQIKNILLDITKIDIYKLTRNNQRIIDETKFFVKTQEIKLLEIKLRKFADKFGLLIPNKQSAGDLIGDDL